MTNVTCTDDPCVGGDTDGHESYIRLLSGCQGEQTARAECGCHLTQEEDGDVALFRCPLHDADVLNERETATVLAALRLWQRRGFKITEAIGEDVAHEIYLISTGGDGVMPLRHDEIDALCERLNVGPSQ